MYAFRSTSVCIMVLALLLTGCGRSKSKSKPQKKEPNNKYTLGQVISFSRGGKSLAYKGGGWADAEPGMTWTNARSARLAFRLRDNVDKPLRLRMRLSGFTNPPALTHQPVDVVVNDEMVAHWQVSDLGDYVAIIPADLADHEQLLVELRIPEAVSPKVLGVSDDARVLGLACHELAITNAEADEQASIARASDRNPSHTKPYRFGTVLNLGVAGGAQRYKGGGWYPAERQSVWTARDAAVLEFDLPGTTKPLKLKMRLAGLTSPELLPVQLAEVYANGRRVAEWLVAAPAEHQAIIPNRVLKENGKLRLELRAPKATTPRVLRISNDPRVLGVKVHDVVITEAAEDEAGMSPVTNAADGRTL